jgi:hypothetical protein
VLPVTELCSDKKRKSNDVFGKGSGVYFDFLASRSYSLRVFVFRRAYLKPSFSAAAGSINGIIIIK